MAYDEGLAERIREHFEGEPGVVEKQMFGGIAYMYRGNMAVGIQGDALMVRLGDAAEHALGEPGTDTMNMGSKQMKGWVLVDADTIADDGKLTTWIDRGVEYAGSLPPK